MKRKTQLDILLDFFKKQPYKNIPHSQIVDGAVQEWKKTTGKVFRDPDRGIRSLYERGLLIKIKKGVYCYNPKKAQHKKLKDFTDKQKKDIFKRDKYKCVLCGKGKKEGVELRADHIKPKSLGGESKVINGQTLCSRHNFIKKNLEQTETGKKMFIRLYELSKKEKNKVLKDFCSDILKTYKKYDINGHIDWKE